MGFVIEVLILYAVFVIGNGFLTLPDSSASQTGSSSASKYQDALLDVLGFLSDEKVLRRQLEQIVQQMQRDMTELKQHNVTGLVENLVSMNKSLENLKHENQALKQDNNDMKQLTAQLQLNNQNQKQEIYSVQQLAVKLQTENQALKQDTHDVQQLYVKLQLDNQNQSHEINNLKQENQALKQHNDHVDQLVMKLQLDKQNITKEIEYLKQQDTSFQLENQNQTQDIQELKLKEATCRNDVNSLMTNVSLINGQTQAIGFAARFSYGSRSGGILKFDDIIENLGNRYNTSTGKFTCDRSGLYIFHFTMLSDTRVAVGWIRKGNTNVAEAYTSNLGGWNTGSVSAVIHLIVGDEVWVQSGGSYHYGNYNYFSGALISA